MIRGNERINVRSKDMLELQPGDIVALSLGGGGGYGDPAARSLAAIERDVEDGIISPGQAAAWPVRAAVS